MDCGGFGEPEAHRPESCGEGFASSSDIATGSLATPCERQEHQGLLAAREAPDWQSLGLAIILAKNLNAAFKATNCRFRAYPSHPSLIRPFVHQKGDCSMEKRDGDFSPARSCSSQVGGFGARPSVTFECVGQQMTMPRSLRNAV